MRAVGSTVVIRTDGKSDVAKGKSKVQNRSQFSRVNAGIAQLVEQLICNQQVIGSSPIAGFLCKSLYCSRLTCETRSVG